MRVKTWKIIDYGEVPPGAPTISYSCPRCGSEAEMPVKGRALAQLAGGGIVFDTNEIGALPATVQCRRCSRVFSTDPEPSSDVR
jgi:DNA-directed RNA polymerase subunit RPC12/RpoP